MRTLWAATELNLAYEHLPLSWDDPKLNSTDFLRLNPAGSIPTVVDEGVAIAESMAINLYLAKKYGRGAPLYLYPVSLAEEAHAWRWGLWAQGHLEPWVQRDVEMLALRHDNPEAWSAVVRRSLETLGRAL